MMKLPAARYGKCSSSVGAQRVGWNDGMGATLLQEFTKLLDGQPGVTNDPAESKGVDRVMAWDRQDAHTI